MNKLICGLVLCALIGACGTEKGLGDAQEVTQITDDLTYSIGNLYCPGELTRPLYYQSFIFTTYFVTVVKLNPWPIKHEGVYEATLECPAFVLGGDSCAAQAVTCNIITHSPTTDWKVTGTLIIYGGDACFTGPAVGHPHGTFTIIRGVPTPAAGVGYNAESGTCNYRQDKFISDMAG